MKKPDRTPSAATPSLRQGIEALVDVMPYLHPNPNSPHAEKWESWKQAALDKAAAALDVAATPSRVLVACEFSGVVRDAFRTLGHDAVSCDFLPTERPGPHIQADVRSLDLTEWDMLIAHPPCTHLARAGARWWAEKQREQEEALDFVRWLLDAPVPRIAVENPPGKIGTAIRPATQYVQPWWFGHGETKMTGLWLKGLAPLIPTWVVQEREPRVHFEPPGPDRWMRRSRTLPGLAGAMAAQWGGLIELRDLAVAA